MISSSRPLGWGLLATGGVLAAIVLLWLAVELAGGQLTPGGAVLGLLLAAVLGLPLLGGGLYLLSRAPSEAAEASANERLRSLLERDRALRSAWSRDLRQLADRLAARNFPDLIPLATRLNDLARDLDAPGYERTLWTDGPDEAARQALQRYDNLLAGTLRNVMTQVEQLESSDVGERPVEPRVRAAVTRLRAALDEFERDVTARSDLLTGRPAPDVPAADLLAARESAEISVEQLAPGDAVTRDGIDFLVEISAAYFSGEKTWRLHRLVAERDAAWLAVGPGALRLAWLQPTSVPVAPGALEIRLGATAYRLAESWTAAVEVRTRQGAESSGTATVWRYGSADGGTVWLERWPDRQVALGGNPIAPHELEIWPATLRPDSSSG